MEDDKFEQIHLEDIADLAKSRVRPIEGGITPLMAKPMVLSRSEMDEVAACLWRRAEIEVKEKSLWTKLKAWIGKLF
jgi:hypothetical protein